MRGLVFATVNALSGFCRAIVSGVVTCGALGAGWAVFTVEFRVSEPQTPEAPHGAGDILTHFDLHVANWDFPGELDLVEGKNDAVCWDQHTVLPRLDTSRRGDSEGS